MKYRERYIIAATAGMGTFVEYLEGIARIRESRMELPELMLHNRLRNAMFRKAETESKHGNKS